MQIRSGNLPPSIRRPGILILVARLLLWLGLCSFRGGAGELPVAPAPAPPGGAPTLPASVDLRPAFDKWELARRTQGERGTCSAFTLAGALEFAAANKLQRGERFSPEFLNWAANQIVGENVDGGFFSDLWSGFATYGICLEQTLPYRAEFDPTLTPAADALAEAKTRLALGLRCHWIKMTIEDDGNRAEDIGGFLDGDPRPNSFA